MKEQTKIKTFSGPHIERDFDNWMAENPRYEIIHHSFVANENTKYTQVIYKTNAISERLNS